MVHGQLRRVAVHARQAWARAMPPREVHEGRVDVPGPGHVFGVVLDPAQHCGFEEPPRQVDGDGALPGGVPFEGREGEPPAGRGPGAALLITTKVGACKPGEGRLTCVGEAEVGRAPEAPLEAGERRR